MTGNHGSHGHGGQADNMRRIFWALVLTGGFMLAEIVGAVISGVVSPGVV